ncbi:hypothetical protein [Novosphingobium rosa]|uniref:hypothetical protein n=1 Tax=Novosphingobium rosa TaxID=76978 RepID=UPI000829737E|nr:hypothetical protein [Novosphingobium rosa]
MPLELHSHGCPCERCPAAQPHPDDSRFIPRCLPIAIPLSGVLWIALWAALACLFPDAFAH